MHSRSISKHPSPFHTAIPELRAGHPSWWPLHPAAGANSTLENLETSAQPYSRKYRKWMEMGTHMDSKLLQSQHISTSYSNQSVSVPSNLSFENCLEIGIFGITILETAWNSYICKEHAKPTCSWPLYQSRHVGTSSEVPAASRSPCHWVYRWSTPQFLRTRRSLRENENPNGTQMEPDGRMNPARKAMEPCIKMAIVMTHWKHQGHTERIAHLNALNALISAGLRFELGGHRVAKLPKHCRGAPALGV